MSEINNAEAAAAAAEVMPEEEVELNQTHAANINLDKVAVTDGEEGEECLYTERAALYRFAESDNEWKERARGDVKFLKNAATGHIRVVMRQEKTLKVRLNQYVGDIELKPNAGSDKAWTWRWTDYATDSGEPETHSFAIRFRNADNANAFNAQWEAARQNNKDKKDGEKKTEEVAATEEATTEETAEPEKTDA